jgi:hypothetical protein
MRHQFIICDPTLARLILEGDSSKHIHAGEKTAPMKKVDKVTMNIPSILTKRTHGEG